MLALQAIVTSRSRTQGGAQHPLRLPWAMIFGPFGASNGQLVGRIDPE